MVNLRNNNLQERHWDEIHNLLGFEIKGDKNFTLGDLVNEGVTAHADQITVSANHPRISTGGDDGQGARVEIFMLYFNLRCVSWSVSSLDTSSPGMLVQWAVSGPSMNPSVPRTACW